MYIDEHDHLRVRDGGRPTVNVVSFRYQDKTLTHFSFHDHAAVVELCNGVPTLLHGLHRAGTKPTTQLVKPSLQVNTKNLTIRGTGHVVLDAAGCLRGVDTVFRYDANADVVYVGGEPEQIEISGQVYEFSTPPHQYACIELGALESIQVLHGTSLRIEKPDCVAWIKVAGTGSRVMLAADQKYLCHVTASASANVTVERGVQVGDTTLILKATCDGTIHIKGEVAAQLCEVSAWSSGTVIVAAAKKITMDAESKGKITAKGVKCVSKSAGMAGKVRFTRM